MKVKHIAGEDKGQEAHLGFHEAQAALAADAVEPVAETVTDFPVATPASDAVPAKDVNVDYDSMTRVELDKLAVERGVDVSKAGNKAEVIAALRAA